MTNTTTLNADHGESFGAWTMGEDEALLQVVRSANIACGFHAGDPVVMRHTVRTALAAGVSLGAHPAYPDLQGFGRRPMKMAPAELRAMGIYQVGVVAGRAAGSLWSAVLSSCVTPRSASGEGTLSMNSARTSPSVSPVRLVR